MNHEMNTLAIGRQEAFSTMVSNKVPATAHCLSDGIHKAKRAGENNRGQKIKGRALWERGEGEKTTTKHGNNMRIG